MKKIILTVLFMLLIACGNESRKPFVAQETEIDETQTDLPLTDETQNDGEIVETEDTTPVEDSDTEEVVTDTEDEEIITETDSEEVVEDTDTGVVDGEVTEEVVDGETEDETEDVIPEEYCGNGVQDPGEVCDAEIVDCKEINNQYTSGQANCLGTCDGYDETKCTGGEYGGPYEFDLTINGENILLVADTAECLYEKGLGLLNVNFKETEEKVLTAQLKYKIDLWEMPEQPLERSQLYYRNGEVGYGSMDVVDLTIDFLGYIGSRPYLEGELEFDGALGGGTINTETLKFRCEMPEDH